MNDKRGDISPREEVGTLTLEREKTKRPRKFAVVLHNDDYTTQEFVVHVLMKFFRKDAGEANKLMLAVHVQGKAKVAVYIKDVAQSKVQLVSGYARENGMPLMVSAEPE